MAEQKVGITVFVKDKASKAVAGIAKRAGLIGKAVAKVQSGFKAFGFALIAANQGAELLGKAFGAVKAAIGSSIQAAIELRGEGDPLVRKFKSLKTTMSSISGVIGSSLIAAITSIGVAFKPALTAAKAFLESNRELIAVGVVDFIFDVANALINGVAEGAQLASTAMTTLKQVFYTSVKGLVDITGAFATFIGKGDELAQTSYELEQAMLKNESSHSDFSDTIEVTRKKVSALVNKGYKPAIKAAKELSKTMGDTNTESVEKRIADFREKLGALQPKMQEAFKGALKGKDRKAGMLIAETFERDLDLISRKIQTLSRATLPAVAKEVEESFRKIGIDFKFPVDENNLELMKELADLAVTSQEAGLLFEKEDFNLIHDGLENTAEKLKALKEAQKGLNAEAEIYDSILKSVPQAIGQIGTQMGTVIGEVISGQKKSGQAFVEVIVGGLNTTIEIIKQSIMAYAVKAMAAVMAGEVATKGPFGLITGLVLGSMVMSAFQGILGKVPTAKGYNKGGYVTGGVPGRDSVPAMLTPGEYVLNTEQTAAMMGGGGSNITINTAVPPSRGEMKRYIRQNLIPAMRDLKAQGILV